jgi:subtilase family serine protease
MRVLNNMKSRSHCTKAFFAIFTCRFVAKPGCLLALFAAIAGPLSAHAGEMRVLPGHVPAAAALWQRLGRVPGTNSLRFAISLPLRHSEELTNLLHRLYDPAGPDYHRYLTSAQFTEQFGPTAQQYQTVMQFAESSGLEIVAARDSRMLLDVRGKASDVEKAFHVTLWRYQHPTEARQFYAPDVEPTVDAGLPILDIVGLGDYAVPRPMLHAKPVKKKPVTASGSESGGYYLGSDFRNAYVPGVSLTGAGQMVGLLELDSYYNSNIVAYETLAGLPNVPLVNVNVTNANATPGSAIIEVSLDIEMAIAMAPGLAAVVVFEAGSDTDVTGFQDILDSMASSNQIKQFSSSWGFTGITDPETSFDTEFQKMAAQGQSFYQASGDGDAWIDPIWVPADSPYLTSVGGTSLAMNGAGVSYSSETVWNEGNQGSGGGWSPNETVPGSRHNKNDYIGSGGGVSTVYTIPSWQTNAISGANHGSSTMRNIPDVALTASNIFVIATYEGDYDWSVSGTSCAAPLWAGFTALVNQQATAGGNATVGFINPAIYTLGQGSSYASAFHDITTGNNINAYSDNLYPAVSGYDLCTGWGTPNGAGLINALAGAPAPESLQITPSAGFVSSGPYGGPFSVTNQNFILTNIGAASLNWSLINTSLWLTASSSGGTLVPGGAAASVNVGLNSAAASLTVGAYTNTVVFSNLNDSVTQSRQFILTVSQAAPGLSWATPSAISYGTALGPTQLDATANVSGSFAYSPIAGTVLNTGTSALSVTFTPSNTVDYSGAIGGVSLAVSPAPLTVTAADASQTYGQTNPVFTGTITGLTNGDNITAIYSCSATTNSPVGMYPIVPSLVDPDDRQTNYVVSLNNGTLTITMAAPVLSWANPAAIAYGAALGSNQLDATANVSGNFAYDPSAGTVLGPGTNTLSVLFTPADAVDYSNANVSVSLVVFVAPIALNIQLAGNEVILSWNDPASVFTLQSAPAITGPFTNVPGAASPYTNDITDAQLFFQLVAPAN